MHRSFKEIKALLPGHLEETIKLGYPVAIGQLSHVMLGVEDSLMVGAVGSAPLAASSLVNGLVMLIVIFGLGLTFAISPLVSIERGKENIGGCGIILRQSLLLNMAASFILILVIFGMSFLIPFLNQPEKVAQEAVPYAQIIGLSVLPFMLFQTYRQFTEGLTFMKPAMYITILANGINIFSNWLFIYGNWGMPALGLKGAGISTLATRIFMAAAMMTYVLHSPRFKPFDAGLRFKSINRPVMKEILRIGIPSGMQNFFEIGAFAFSAIMIGWLGDKSLAAHQIALSMASASFMVVLGIAAAGTIRVGHALGQNNIGKVRLAGFSAMIMSAAVMITFAVSFVIGRHWFPALFIDDQEVLALCSTLMIIAAIFQISDGQQAVGLGILRGIKDVKIPMYFSFIAYWVVGLPVGYILGFVFGFGVNGIWFGFVVALSLAATFFICRFFYRTKQLAGKQFNS
ncbi:MAG: MATE family efflux transporter [Calditrichaceae bacterium]|nr:MATE family efflux transporter [Calditrichaceae bacterium]MBN2708691.1 MATE family efflux transporter [Calditrichaceae bacterium]RQV92804.1 MAG: MATE family efflux transporter [Calditrichota bacterium]